MALIDEMIAMKRLAESFVQSCEKIIGSFKQADQEKEHERNLFSDLEDLIEVREPVKKARVRKTRNKPFCYRRDNPQIANIGKHYGKNTKEIKDICDLLHIEYFIYRKHTCISGPDSQYLSTYLERKSNQIKSE